MVYVNGVPLINPPRRKVVEILYVGRAFAADLVKFECGHQGLMWGKSWKPPSSVGDYGDCKECQKRLIEELARTSITSKG